MKVGQWIDTLTGNQPFSYGASLVSGRSDRITDRAQQGGLPSPRYMPSPRNFILDAFYSLGANINKPKRDSADQETTEGVVGEILPELRLDMDEQSLIGLSDQWENAWKNSEVRNQFERKGKENEKYWKGDQFDRPKADSTRPMVDNVIFESLETYLPQVTRRNPEPMVTLAVGVEQSSENQAFATALKLELSEIADDIKLRLKLKGAARHKEMYLLGAVKLSWDIDNDRPQVKVVRPQRLILDPNAVVDEDGYSGNRIGEMRQLSASRLIELVKGEERSEELVKYIKETAKDKLETELNFIEWWTPDYMFWKLGTKVLRKRKNPHWNYEESGANEAAEVASEENPALPQGAPQLPEPAPTMPSEGMPAVPEIEASAPVQPVRGVNHFKSRRIPYVLISTLNLGKQPVDETSLMSQNLAMQDVVNKRNRQIDNNADDMNNGLVVSLERSGLTKDQAAGVTKALRRRGIVAIPSGAPQEAVWRPTTPGLPADVYNDLNDKRNRIRSIFGTIGLSPVGLSEERTVRGKIMNRQVETDRIGGGISEYLEQFSDDIYNWITQLLFVYDDRFQQAFEQGTQLPRVKVSIKEGSLLPKDSTTLANQAIELAAGGSMSLVDLYKALEYPNPEEMAANAWLQQNAPEVLFENDPRVKKVIEQKMMAAMAAQGMAPPAPAPEGMPAAAPEGEPAPEALPAQ